MFWAQFVNFTMLDPSLEFIIKLPIRRYRSNHSQIGVEPFDVAVNSPLVQTDRNSSIGRVLQPSDPARGTLC